MAQNTKRIATLLMSAVLVAAPSVALAQEGADLVGTARAAAVRSAQIANETALAAQSGEGKKRGLERAAQAVKAAEDRGNGNGRALGRGNAAKVLAALAAGESPSGIGKEHGKAVSAAARGLSKVAGEKSNNGNGWGKGGNPNKGADEDDS
jgi:hypothetical protein